MGVGGVLHVVVNREEAAGDGVVNPSVHVDEVELHHVLVPREAAVEEQREDRRGLAAWGDVVGRAPRVEPHVLHHVAVPGGEGGPAAQMVGMDVVHPPRLGLHAGVPHGEHAEGTAQVGETV